MPPKIKTLAQKRKAAESGATNKRIKQNPDGPVPSLQSVSPAKKNTIVKLSGPLPKVPDNAYVNPTAQKLFLEVEAQK